VTGYLLHPAAETEYREAVEYYDNQREGLGDLLVDQLEDSIEKICRNPETWPKWPKSQSIRRFRLEKFPYSIVYKYKNDFVTVFAIMHLNRKPNYWRKRLSSG
jgi:toxin ParE1/3/4